MKNKKLSVLVKISILSAMALILMFILEFPLPIFPEFLKLDLSEVPVLLGTFALGPYAGVIIELVKNLIHVFLKPSTMGIGELANFVVGSSMVLTAGFIYKRERNKKGALKGLIVGTIVMAIVAAISNYYVFLPLYESVLGFKISMIVDMSSKVNPSIKDLNTLIIYSIIPFNLFKGMVTSLITFLLYKRVSPILHK